MLVIVQDWHAHKVAYPWLIPGFNQHLSRLPSEYWKLTSNDTNLVETAHVGTNHSTGIGLSPLEAIRSYAYFHTW